MTHITLICRRDSRIFRTNACETKESGPALPNGFLVSDLNETELALNVKRDNKHTKTPTQESNVRLLRMESRQAL